MMPTSASVLDTLFNRRLAGEISHQEMLLALVDALRPHKVDDEQQVLMNIRALAYVLEHQPGYRQAIRQTLLAVLMETRQLPLYTESGILANTGFFSTLFKRLGERLMPFPYKATSLKDRLGSWFHHKHDYLWLGRVPASTWGDLWQAMSWHEEQAGDGIRHTRRQMLEALQVLSARVTAIGLEPELVRLCPEIEQFESPFLHLNAETLKYTEAYRHDMTQGESRHEDEKHMLVLLDQCEAILGKMRKNVARYGISVALTYHALRLHQHIQRMRALLTLLDPAYNAAAHPELFSLLVELVKAENRQYSLRDVFKGNTELLALQVTEHAGRHGEHYIAESRADWRAMGKAAMGAGVIVGFMALFKLMLAKAHLPLLWEGLSYGLNYALGFILVQLLHFTIATKQPAMTAARLASELHQQQGQAIRLEAFTDLVIKVVRTQFVAIMGNVLVVLPISALIAWGWQGITGSPVVNAEKAGHLLHDLDPVTSLAIFHAAIAGVYLFLSGLIAGYYDNLAIYRHIPERLAEQPLLKRLLGPQRAWRLGQYVEHNLGALAGNFYFGLFLGLTGTIGTMLGLPLDIRHITFAAANLAYAGVVLNWQIGWPTLLWSLAGIGLIGLVNLAVSFNLALWVALRSRKVEGRQVWRLFPSLAWQFVRHPLRFLVPPKV